MAEKYIKLHSRLIPVTEDVYYAYYHMGRQRRTQKEKDSRRRIASYDALDTENCLGIDLLVDEQAPTVEEIATTHILIEKLRCCLTQLPESDQRLIRAIFFVGLSERKLAKQMGIPHMTIHDRKIRVLKKLQKMMSK